MPDATAADVPTQPLSLPARPDRTGGRAIGVLLVHGFTGSPASMKPWARYLAEQGYAVEVPRLPGHGTTWQDLNQVAWTDWYAEADARLRRPARRRATPSWSCGLSMGGSVALRLAEERGDEVSGVVLVNPFVVEQPQGASRPCRCSSTSSRRSAASSTTSRSPTRTRSATPRLPLKGLAQVMEMWKVVVPDLGRVTQPLLYFRSTVDHVIDDLVVAYGAERRRLDRRRGADRSRTATTSPRSTTTLRGSSRSPRLSSRA